MTRDDDDRPYAQPRSRCLFTLAAQPPYGMTPKLCPVLEHFSACSTERIDTMKRLIPDSTWWPRVPHREITRSVAQGEGGQPWTILASICTKGKARSVSWLRAAR